MHRKNTFDIVGQRELFGSKEKEMTPLLIHQSLSLENKALKINPNLNIKRHRDVSSSKVSKRHGSLSKKRSCSRSNKLEASQINEQHSAILPLNISSRNQIYATEKSVKAMRSNAIE